MQYCLKRGSKTFSLKYFSKHNVYSHKKALEHAKRAVVDCTKDFIRAPRVQADPLRSDVIKKKVNKAVLFIAYNKNSIGNHAFHSLLQSWCRRRLL